MKKKPCFIDFRNACGLLLFINVLFLIGSICEAANYEIKRLDSSGILQEEIESISESVELSSSQGSNPVPVSERMGRTYGPTTWKDTLLELALKLRPDENVTVQQTMVALRDQNSEAFIDGNINLLCRGHWLRIPTLDQIRQITQEQALLQIYADNERFIEIKKKPGLIDESQCELVGEVKIEQYNESYPELAELPEFIPADVYKKEEQLATMPQNTRPRDEIIPRKTAAVMKTDSADEAETEKREDIINPVSKEPGQGILSDSLYLGFFTLAAFLMLVGLLLVARRKSNLTVVPVSMAGDNISGSNELSESSGPGSGKDEPPQNETHVDEKKTTEQEPDYTLGKADIYIAYGRFQQAIDFLQEEIKKAPDKLDLRLKLLEVYVETRNQTGLDQQYAAIIASGDEEAIADAEAKKKRCL